MTFRFPTLFIRHGQKDSNTKIDPELTAKGRLQAMITGRHVAQNYGNLDWENTNIIVSPYKRTIQTAILALAQKDWGDTVPTLILDPLISETIADANCVGSERDTLLEWLDKENLYENLTAYVNEAVHKGLIAIENKDKVFRNITQLITSMDISKIKDGPTQEWWPKGSSKGGFETATDAQARMKKVNEQYNQHPRVLFTHSTFISDIFCAIQPTPAFGLAVNPEITQRVWLASLVREAALYDVRGSQKPAIIGYFDPAFV